MKGGLLFRRSENDKGQTCSLQNSYLTEFRYEYFEFLRKDFVRGRVNGSVEVGDVMMFKPFESVHFWHTCKKAPQSEPWQILSSWLGEKIKGGERGCHYSRARALNSVKRAHGNQAVSLPQVCGAWRGLLSTPSSKDDQVWHSGSVCPAQVDTYLASSLLIFL